MKHPRVLEIMKRAVRAAQAPDVALLEGEGTVPVTSYTSAERFALERQKLFREMPLPIAHVGELSRESNVLVREVAGVSLLLTRGEDGAVRAFRNSCRHRGVRLARDDCRAKAFTCPYHGWTYGLDGSLLHIPHPQAFPSCDRASRGLVQVAACERHGLVWVTVDAPSADASAGVARHLGSLDDEMASFGFDRHVVGRRAVTEQRGNWKMLVEAFLDGYHIRQLHRSSVYPFFLDGRSVAEREGIHVRAASARRAAKELGDIDGAGGLDAMSERAMRDIATLSYVLFPSTTLIMHPDWTSLVVVEPLAADRFSWSHTQLIAEEHAPRTDEARAHFDRSFDLIEGNVFQKEDLLMCAEMQAGIATGANIELTFGQLESPAVWLHASIAGVLQETRSNVTSTKT